MVIFFSNITLPNDDVDYSMKMVISFQSKNNQFQNIVGRKIVRNYQNDENGQNSNEECPRKYIKINILLCYE